MDAPAPGQAPAAPSGGPPLYSDSDSEGSRYEPSGGEGGESGTGNIEPSARPTDSVVEFWKKFTIKDAVDAFLQAWASITKANVRHAWRRVAPFFSEAPDFEGFPTPQ